VYAEFNICSLVSENPPRKYNKLRKTILLTTASIKKGNESSDHEETNLGKTAKVKI